jgi:ABC-2 type transport system ATP-binding protein
MLELELKKVTKRFSNIVALNSVSIRIDRPGCVGVLGPNGAGKTTMFKILTGMVYPTSGVALINGINIAEESYKAMKYVGSLVEQPEFYSYLTAKEILTFVARIKGLRGRSVEDEIIRVSSITHTSSYLNRKAGTFSRGMKQRLALAAAIINDPPILILDEPTFGLDPSGMKEIRDLIKIMKKKKDKLIILSTHLIYEAREVCDVVYIVNKGKIVYGTETFSEEREIKVELESLGDTFTAHLPGAELVDVHGNTIILRKKENVSNSNVIYALQREGYMVKWVSPVNSLEDTYVSIVGDQEN